MLLAETENGAAPSLPFALDSVAGAKQALPLLEQKRGQLTAQRARIGAKQSRLDVAQNVLITARENFQAAESRIRDADVALEAAKLLR